MIRIITDSACDLGKITNTKELTVVPLHINIDGIEYADTIDISPDEFYDKISKSKEFPKTSQPTPKYFYEAMKPGVEASDEILVITISSALSGTIGSVNLAKNMFDYDKITVFDSLQATGGERILVDAAVRFVKEGFSVNEIVAKLTELRKKIVYLTMIDDLSYLVKGGRLKKTEGLIGNLAHLKLMIEVDELGKLGIFHKAIGRPRAFRFLVKKFKETEIDNNYPVYTAYTDDDKNLNKLVSKLSEQLADSTIIESRFGPTIGTHLGKTALALFYVKK